MTDAEADSVFDYWFGTLSPADWWRTNPAVDAELRARFGALHARLSRDPEARAASLRTPRTLGAAILVLDQLSRNLHRGEAAAFASDADARALSDALLARGWDIEFAPQQRAFLYMPYMHSENAPDHGRSVSLFAALAHSDHLRHAIEHAVVIVRFGRYPTRNKALGRADTAREAAYLATQSGAV